MGSLQFLERANNRSEKIWKTYLKYVIGYFLIGSASLKAAMLGIGWIDSELFNYLNNKGVYRTLMVKLVQTALDAKNAFTNLYTPKIRLCRLPWNQNTLLGLCGEFGFGLLYGVTYCIVSWSFSLLFISICMHHMAFYEVFRYSIQKLNVPVKNRENAEFLRKIINFHRSIKRC